MGHLLKSVTLGALVAFAGMAQANEAENLVLELYEVLQAENYEGAKLATMFADDYVDHTRPSAYPESMSDKEVILAITAAIKFAVSDGTRHVVMIAPADENTAVSLFEFSGTNDGSFFDMPITDKVVTFRGFDLYRVEDGQFVEHWHVEDMLGFFGQMGG